MGRKHLIAIDGSDQAQHAFDWSLDNVIRDGDTILLAHCAEYNINIGLPGTKTDISDINAICEQVKKRNDEIGNLTDGFMNVLRQKKINAKLLTLTGDKPGECLTKAAKEEGAEHIVMGTRGLGKLRRTLLGSVSEYVLHHADCPVTIVRKSED